MPFRFKPSDGSWESGFRRIACAELDATLGLIRAAELPPERIVHQVRRGCKAMRGLLRLIHPAFPAYAEENRAFGELSRGLSGVRDGKVLIQTLDNLIADEDLPTPAIAALRAEWIQEIEVAHQGIAAQIDVAANALLAARVRAVSWYLTEQGGEAILPGLRRTYRKARSAMQAIDASGGASNCEASHEWRKQVKYHWQHMRLLRSLAPDVAKRRLKRADLLGERHDLDMLIARLGSVEAPHAGELIVLAEKRAAILTRKAARAGKTLFEEEASGFIARCHKELRESH
jgi:hypothetical protein